MPPDYASELEDRDQREHALEPEEWIPAWLIDAHGDTCAEYQRLIGRGIKVRVRPTVPHPWVRELWKCDATRFFEVNQEDAPAEMRRSGLTAIACEHEALTD
jgi:hypothetical protein